MLIIGFKTIIKGRKNFAQTLNYSISLILIPVKEIIAALLFYIVIKSF
jgi:hypothetical protein